MNCIEINRLIDSERFWNDVNLNGTKSIEPFEVLFGCEWILEESGVIRCNTLKIGFWDKKLGDKNLNSYLFGQDMNTAINELDFDFIIRSKKYNRYDDVDFVFITKDNGNGFEWVDYGLKVLENRIRDPKGIIAAYLDIYNKPYRFNHCTRELEASLKDLRIFNEEKYFNEIISKDKNILQFLKNY